MCVLLTKVCFVIIIHVPLFQQNMRYMAKNGKVGDGHRNGAVKERSQTLNTKTEIWTKRDTNTGKFMDGKADGKPFKGVTKE